MAYSLSLLLLTISFLLVHSLPVLPGDSCNIVTEGCSGIPNTQCLISEDGTHRCLCVNGFLLDSCKNRCITPPFLPGEPCASLSCGNVTCSNIQYSTCQDKTGNGGACTCIDSTAQLPNKCLLKPVYPGDECHSDLAPCTSVANTYCMNDNTFSYEYCKCMGGQINDFTKKVCLTPPNLPGDSCDQNLTPCTSIPNTECRIGGIDNKYICICNPDYVTDFVEKLCLKKPINPGDKCTPHLNDCTHVLHTDCSENSEDIDRGTHCKCIGDLVTDYDLGVCLTKPTIPGDLCNSELTPCTPLIPHTECKDSYCQCVPGYISHPTELRCLLFPSLPTDECLPLVATCNDVKNTSCKATSGTSYKYSCICFDYLGTDTKYKKCVEYPFLPGDPCETNNATCDSVPFTYCADNPEELMHFCKCNDEYATDILGRRCVKHPTKPGQICELPFTDCSTVTGTIHTSCTNLKVNSPSTYCKCDGLDFVTDRENERCWRIPVNPGDECHPVLTPCAENNVSNTTCSENTCVCDANLINIGLSCISIPLLPNDECFDELASCDLVQNTTCLDNFDGSFRCKCDNPLITDPDFRICIQSPQAPGDTCTPKYAPCPIASNTTCQFSVDGALYCTCTEGFVTDFVTKRCLEIPENPGDHCDPVINPCPSENNTICRGDGNGGYICKCIPGYSATDKKCIINPIFPGDECFPVDVECDHIDNTTCENIQDPFDEIYQCTCEGDLVTWDRKCIPLPLLPGDSCSPEIANCSAIPNTECTRDNDDFGDYCKCFGGYFTHFQKRQCVPIPSLIGDSCDNNDTATCFQIENAACIAIGSGEYVCRCSLEISFPDGYKCTLLPSKPYDKCLTNSHCELAVPHTYCDYDETTGNPSCVCMKEYTLSSDGLSCLKKAEYVGDPCEIDSYCDSIPNTHCELDDFGYGFCNCVDEVHVPNSNHTSCLPIIYKLGEDCVETIQCLAGIKSPVECTVNGLCGCVGGYVENIDLSKCLKASGLYEPCEDIVQCQAALGELSYCDNMKFCLCQPIAGYLNSKCYRQVHLGMPCQYVEECFVGINNFTTCHVQNKVCECSIDSLEYEQTCYANLILGDKCTSDLHCSVPISNAICDRGNRTCTCNTNSFPINVRQCSGLSMLKPGQFILIVLLMFVIVTNLF